MSSARQVNGGLVFWLFRLKGATCPSCKRDVIWRRSRPDPVRCHWCGASMIDWAALTRAVQRFAEASLTDFAEAARATVHAFRSFDRSVMGQEWTWTVEVETATHDDLKAGNTTTRVSRVSVLAPSETEAKLVASQMAARPGRIPTRATVVDPRQLNTEREEPQLAEAHLHNPLASAMNLRRGMLKGGTP